MNADFPESMSDGHDRQPPEPGHPRPDPCTGKHSRPKCVLVSVEFIGEGLKVLSLTKEMISNHKTYMHSKVCLGKVIWFNGIPALDGYLMPNVVYTYDFLVNSF